MQVNAKAAAFFAGLFFLVSTSVCAQDIATRTFTDAAGREVVVPAKIDRVFAAGPPAAILVYTLAPDKLLGWSREVRPAELHHFAGPELGVVVGFERGHVKIDGATVPVDIRATSTYRVEDGRWAMIGHHTDPLG